MERLFTRTTQVLIDMLVLSVALWLAFIFRFELLLPLQLVKKAAFLWPYVVGLQYLVLVGFSVPRFAWRYVGLREVARVLWGTGISAAVLLVLRLIAAPLRAVFPYAEYMLLPIGVIAIDFMLAFLGVSGVRVLRRLLDEHSARRERERGDVREVRTILIGAGQAGLMLAKELANRPDLGIEPVGFVDDDVAKQGTTLHGIGVLGTTAELAKVAKKTGAKQALIAIANAPGHQIRRIKELCDDAGLPTKIVPGIYEIVGGQVNLTRIRNVSIEDLLGREPVVLETDVVASSMAGKVVVVTGAGGSIGSEICRQVCRFGPQKLVLVEQAENALFQIHRELIASFPDLAPRISPRIADITDAERVRAIFVETRPEVVFHAAAHKHVPMMEWNPGEAVKNNVLGTRTLADAADRHGVRQFVMISTDKAVNPTSVMGVSKRTAEIYVQALSQRSRTRFVTVRFGNVLGSAGSVIPIFQEQIAKGGPVTVTHPEMKRYFMTIPEACQLVLQAGAMGEGGEIFILDMGQPVKIVDVARDLIRLSGLRPDEDIEIVFSGMRPGEKLFEELSVADEFAEKTRHPKIFIGRIRPHPYEEVVARIQSLLAVANQGNPEAVRARFREIVPEYTPNPLAEAPPPKPASDASPQNGVAPVPALATVR